MVGGLGDWSGFLQTLPPGRNAIIFGVAHSAGPTLGSKPRNEFGRARNKISKYFWCDIIGYKLKLY